ncbi:MAG: Alpha-galactosidase precursor [Pseudomonadota bacterium]|jgi:hypothetical protein
MQNISRTWSFRLSIVAITSFFLVCQLWNVFSAQCIYPVTHFGRAGDFKGFFDTVQAALDSGAIDLAGVFFKPPFFALLLSPLVPLGFDTAAALYQTLVTFVVVVVITTVCWLKTREFWATFALLLVVLCSHAFQFLLDRGNVDAFSLGCVFFAVLAQQMRATLLAALLFAVGVHLKSNVIVFLPILVAQRSLVQTGLASLLFALCIFLIAALTPEWSLQWLDAATHRASWGGDLRENGSIFRAFMPVPHGESIAWIVLGILGSLIILGCLHRALTADHTRRLDLLLLSLPLSQAYPRHTYLYGYVFLPLLLLLYCEIASRPVGHWTERWWCALGCCGVVLSSVPSAFGINSGITAQWFHVLPSVGLVLMLVANVLILWATTSTPREPNEVVQVQRGPARRTFLRFVNLCSVLLFLMLCGASSYSLVSYARDPDSLVMWLPFSRGVVEGAPIPQTPFRVRRAKQGWGSLGINQAVSKNPLTIGGVQYESGLGTHGRSSMELLLPPGARYLSGRCGLDDAAGRLAAGFVCVVRGGQNELFRSGMMKAPGSSESFTVPVSGLSLVTLVIENATKSNSWNQADWVELRSE